MMGRTHALSGAAAWVGAVTAAPSLGLHPSPAVIAAGTLATAGAALLPDIDHPDATIAHLLGPVGHAGASFVNRITGGHRGVTHSLAFASACAGATWLTGQAAGALVMLPLLALLCAFALRAIGLRRRAALICAGVAAAAGALALDPGVHAVVHDDYPWLAAAVGLGAAAHVLGDCLTPEGCPLAWPARGRWSLPLISHTDSRIERYLLAPCFAAVSVGLMAIR